MQSKATTVEQYLAELPDDRRAAIEAVRQMILKNIDKNFEEGIQYGMIGYYVPHSIYPAGYHCDPRQPLPFLNLASQKNHMSLYAMSLYASPDEAQRFQTEWAKTGKKLDMGKSCIRFKKLDDLALDVIGAAIRRVPVKKYIETYESSFKGARKQTKPESKPKQTTKVAQPATKMAAGKKTTSRKVSKKP
jgi:Domain of unknown function (DU1801)